MRKYAHPSLRIIEMHDYHESKTVLTINDNHEFKAENVLHILKFSIISFYDNSTIVLSIIEPVLFLFLLCFCPSHFALSNRLLHTADTFLFYIPFFMFHSYSLFQHAAPLIVFLYAISCFFTMENFVN